MQATPPSFRLRPLRVTELLDAVFSLYRRNFWLFVGLVAVVQVPYQILSFLLGLGTRTSNPTVRPGHALTQGQLHTLFQNLALDLSIFGVLLLLTVALVIPLQTAAFTKGVADRYLGRPATPGSCYRFATRSWLPLVLLGLIYLGLTLAAFLVLSLLGFVLVALVGGGGLVLAILLGLALVVVAILVYVRLVVATPALVLESLGPVAAIRRSWGLTEGHLGRLFGTLISLILVSILISLVLGILVGVVTAAAGTTTPTGRVLEAIGGILVAVLQAPISATGITLMYFDLRVRREAFDIELLAQQISQGSAPA